MLDRAHRKRKSKCMILEVLILNMAIMRPKQRVKLSQQSKVNEFIGNFILETDHMWKWYQCYILNLSHLHIKLHFKELILFLTARVCVCLCVSFLCEDMQMCCKCRCRCCQQPAETTGTPELELWVLKTTRAVRHSACAAGILNFWAIFPAPWIFMF